MVVFKTGTPPCQGFFINYDVTEIQPETKRQITSHILRDEDYVVDQVLRWLTIPMVPVMIIQNNLHRAPMFTGVVKGVGLVVRRLRTRLCALVDKERHQLFLEPEGRNTEEVYVQGLSTSLPEDVQRELVILSKVWKMQR